VIKIMIIFYLRNKIIKNDCIVKKVKKYYHFDDSDGTIKYEHTKTPVLYIQIKK